LWKLHPSSTTSSIYTNTEVGSRPNLGDYLSSVDSRAREHDP